jgi:hypothetical protein
MIYNNVQNNTVLYYLTGLLQFALSEFIDLNFFCIFFVYLGFLYNFSLIMWIRKIN